jgi:hypothetical protein
MDPLDTWQINMSQIFKNRERKSYTIVSELKPIININLVVGIQSKF